MNYSQDLAPWLFSGIYFTFVVRLQRERGFLFLFFTFCGDKIGVINNIFKSLVQKVDSRHGPRMNLKAKNVQNKLEIKGGYNSKITVSSINMMG